MEDEWLKILKIKAAVSQKSTRQFCIEFTVVIQHIFSDSYLTCKSCYFGQLIYLPNNVSADFKSRLDCIFGANQRAQYYCQYHCYENVKQSNQLSKS